MITSLKIKLEPPTDYNLNINMSSLLQGFIMENVPYEFAKSEHVSDLRSYNQYLFKEENQWIWIINAFGEYAEENLINNIISLKEIYLKNKNINIKITSYEINKINFDQLFQKYYFNNENISRYVEIEFITPTAFKSNNKYINYPNKKMLFSSIIKKYDAYSDTTAIYEDNLLDNIIFSTDIIQYNLKTKYFYLEGIKIPGFIGKITIKVTGNKNMISLINMLTDFAQYSGIGIKCAIGMGAIKKTRW